MIKYILIFLIAVSSLKAQWVQSNGIPPDKLIHCFTSCGGKIFAGTGVGILTSGALYSSTDNGVNWQIVDMGVPNPSAVMTLASKDNFIYAGTYEKHYFVSTDAGTTWTNIILNNSAGVFELGVVGNNVVCYTNGTGPIWVSTNNGLNFSNAGNPNIATTNGFLTLGSTMYSASKKGLCYTTNGGFNWTFPANDGMPTYPDGSKPSTSLVYHNGKLYANSIDKIIYTTNNGENWTATNITLANNSNSYSMVSYGGSIYTALYGLESSSRGVLKTSDGGNNWEFMNGGLPAISIRTLFINNEFLLAGTYMGGIYRIPLSTLTGLENENNLIENYSLKQNYPNPFNPETKISFSINKRDFTSLKVYDSMGRVVSVLVNEELKAGNYSFNFNGEKLSSGIYFYKLETGGFNETKKMLLVK